MAAELGRADYSYRFVLEYFRPMLARLGTVLDLSDPLTEPAPLPGVRDVRLLFLPPHQIPLDIADRAIPVFAWEYTTIPTEPFGDDRCNDWREVLSRAPGAITHSRFAVAAVRLAMGHNYPVVALPAPVWDRFAPLIHATHITELTVTAAVLDSHDAGLDLDQDRQMPDPSPGQRTLSFSGPVFTTVVNPYDGRKVWADTITAFVWALRNDRDATLVIKLVHHDRDLALAAAWDFMRRLAPYQCRVVAIHGFLADDEFRDLIRATSFIVNSSRGEGQCLPLMEFMSAGVPAIAPAHTAMADYLDHDNAFVVDSWAEWAWWPHDPRRFLRCMRHPVDWDSLREAFVAAHQTAVGDSEGLASMGTAATEAQRAQCSIDVESARMTSFLAVLEQG